MFSFLFRKQGIVEKLLESYLDNLRKTQECFVEALKICLDENCTGDFDFMTGQTHKYESKADDIREEIKDMMYSKALLPESRGDIMGLLEAMDLIPGIYELLLHIIRTEKIVIPDFIVEDTKELIDVSTASCDLMIQQVKILFTRNKGVRSIVATIDQNESHCDHIERRIISRIFDSNLEPFQKILLKELIVTMGDISDQVDRVSKRVNIISMKRTV
jgi:predicted phosphate transport protein (TIGR00153 family)